MISEQGIWEKHELNVILISIRSESNVIYLKYFYNDGYKEAVLRNPDSLNGNLITGSEIRINLYKPAVNDCQHEAELVLDDSDFMPEAFCSMLSLMPPAETTFFGCISVSENNRGRYYMLRDHNADGLLLCTGTYTVRKGRGCCSDFDGQWPLRYNLIENFFYGFERSESVIDSWKHPSIKLKKIDDSITFKNLNKKFRDYAAGWHRYNYFNSEDWSPEFYLRQAELGFIAITHYENGTLKLIPQLQREYAVLDWENIIIEKKIKNIINKRLKNENIRLHIARDPSETLENLAKAWKDTWITEEYSDLIKTIASEYSGRKRGRVKVWGVTLSAGTDRNIVAGELGYTIGKTYTSLSGFFYRGQKEYNNFGKLQMVLLADVLKNSGISFWNLGQPYMEYKLKLGAKVVPRRLFLKRWDKAVKGKTVILSNDN